MGQKAQVNQKVVNLEKPSRWNASWLKFLCVMGFHNKRLIKNEVFFSRTVYDSKDVHRKGHYKHCFRCVKGYRA